MGEYFDLPELIGQARKDGKWLHDTVSGRWFSPEELKGEIRAGFYLYGRHYWELRDPHDRLQELECKLKAVTHLVETFKIRMSK